MAEEQKISKALDLIKGVYPGHPVSVNVAWWPIEGVWRVNFKDYPHLWCHGESPDFLEAVERAIANKDHWDKYGRGERGV